MNRFRSFVPYVPGIELGPTIPNTRKGTVVHVQPPTAAVKCAAETAEVGWLVFPRWVEGAELRLVELARIEGFKRVASNAFNYEVQGTAGFETVRDLIDRARCYELEYSKLDDAVAALTALVDDHDS